MTDGEAYKELIGKVRAVNEAAAKYLRADARRLDDFCPCSDLDGVMVWSRTPQGHAYWADIAVKIGQWGRGE